MERLTLTELDQQCETFDARVLRTPDADQFCSSSTWIIPAHHALMPPREPWLRTSSHGYVALASGYDMRVGRYLQPLEASWGLASPLIGDDPWLLAQEFVVECRRASDWDVLLLSGIVRESLLYQALVRGFGARHRMGLGMSTRRYQASLDGGPDGFLGRRSSKFRANLRRSSRRAQEQGLTFMAVRDIPTSAQQEEVYDRILTIETESWKGRDGVGITDGPMCAFYRRMIRRLGERGMFRALFAQIDGHDVAYVFGGVLGSTYRGLQVSFDHDFAHLSLGNLVQWQMIQRLCQEGVLWYDLGGELPYKARWAENVLETTMLVVFA
ncbi:MAG: GNAT family N-acetyltransferase [Myxococcota bacterium]